MNWLQIAGHLGADPEERFTATGQKVVTLRVATKARKGGQDITTWWRVTIWGDRFDKMMPYLKKGSPVIAFGEMNKPEIYMDKEGKPQVSLELVADTLKFSPFGRATGGNEGQKGDSYEPQESVKYAAANQQFDDEIPF